MSPSSPNGDETTNMSTCLTDLPNDALHNIMKQLSLKDLCRFSRVCHKIRLQAQEESIWQEQCHWWMLKHGKATGLDAVLPLRLLQQLEHKSYLTLYQTLKAMGGWPEGLYYRVDALTCEGALVWISLRGTVMHIENLDYAARNTGTFCQIALDTTPVQMFIGQRDEEHVSFPIEAFGFNSYAGTAVLTLPFNRQYTATCEDPKSAATWHDGKGNQHPVRPEDWRKATAVSHLYWNPLFNVATPGPQASPGKQRLPQLRLRRVLPLPAFSDLPHPSRPLADLPEDCSPAQALKRLAGLWTACYGSHGPEILHVWFDESRASHNGAPVTHSSSPERRPRPRLVGCKVTGDPNVPANEWSFVAQAFEVRRGEWDGRGTWEDLTQEYRHIVKFDGLPSLVDMSERHVQARFQCWGCINQDPAVFQPKWTSAQLILYQGTLPAFSVLFDDPDERFRHIMDFTPVPLPGPPALAWLT